MNDMFVVGIIIGLILSYASIFHIASGVLIGIIIETRFEKGHLLLEYITEKKINAD